VDRRRVLAVQSEGIEPVSIGLLPSDAVEISFESLLLRHLRLADRTSNERYPFGAVRRSSVCILIAEDFASGASGSDGTLRERLAQDSHAGDRLDGIDVIDRGDEGEAHEETLFASFVEQEKTVKEAL